MNTKNVVIFSVILGGENETSEFSIGGGSSSSILFLVEVKYSKNKPEKRQNRLK